MVSSKMKVSVAFFLAIASALVAVGFPQEAYAEGSSGVYAGGTELEVGVYYVCDGEGGLTAGGTADNYNVYLERDSAQYTLTLNGATLEGVPSVHIGAAIYKKSDESYPLEIVVEGVCTVAAVEDSSGLQAAIVSSDDLTISGQGYLEVRSDLNSAGNEHSSAGIQMLSGEILIESGTICVIGGSSNRHSYGIMAKGDVRITGGELYANCYPDGSGVASAPSYVKRGYSLGILAEGRIALDGGVVYAAAGESERGSYGLCSFADIELDGTTLTAWGEDAALYREPSAIAPSYVARTGSSEEDASWTSPVVLAGSKWVQAGFPVTVSFDANGGAGEMGDQMALRDIPCTLAANEFAREGYRFVGWNSMPDGTGFDYEDQESLVFSGDVDSVTLCAQWSAVLADGNDGDGAAGDDGQGAAGGAAGTKPGSDDGVAGAIGSTGDPSKLAAAGDDSNVGHLIALVAVAIAVASCSVFALRCRGER